MSVFHVFFALFLFPFFLFGSSVHTLFTSIQPESLAQNLALYQLYHQTPEGKEALKRCALKLGVSEVLLGECAHIINRPKRTKKELSSFELEKIEYLGSFLPNRKLKGYLAQSEQEVLDLPTDEVDLGRALVLSENGSATSARHYSALLDIMAFHVISELPDNPTPFEKIKAMNRYVFETMHFRFPPQSVYSKDIDLYTFLPSVMDNHLGVCLGVTALYLALAQRLDLPLEVVTPPGHIYLRYKSPRYLINIETTARGVHIPTEHYLGINTHTLEERTLKQVVGLTHVNQASVYLHRQEYEKAIVSYKKALPYFPEDLLTQELLGYSLVLSGNEQEGRGYLSKICYSTPCHAVKRHVLAEDYLKGAVNHEGLKLVFQEVDETRDSILKKIDSLEKHLEMFPNFRDGLLQIAVCWLQLGRLQEALPYLERRNQIDPSDPTVSYYLSIVHAEKHNFPKSWCFLHQALELVHEKDFHPKALKELELALRKISPEKLEVTKEEL